MVVRHAPHGIHRQGDRPAEGCRQCPKAFGSNMLAGVEHCPTGEVKIAITWIFNALEKIASLATTV
jgi:hypothetical protein